MTKRKDESDAESSFYQIMKGNYDKRTKMREYDSVLGAKYEPKFSLIKLNNHG